MERKPKESFEAYKKRRARYNRALKSRLKGRILWASIEIVEDSLIVRQKNDIPGRIWTEEEVKAEIKAVKKIKKKKAEPEPLTKDKVDILIKKVIQGTYDVGSKKKKKEIAMGKVEKKRARRRRKLEEKGAKV